MPFIFISMVGFMLVLFWDWISTNVTVIGTIATTLAFFAVLWSAFETRKSAKAAFLAVKMAEVSLEEARKNFRKEAFNQRFSLLLEQHNAYLEKVNAFIRSEAGWSFCEKLFKIEVHREAFEQLRGHFICSPYMRVLYHLLKFINDDYYGDVNDVAGRKKYSSLVRSLIGNDVLFLIAVNSSYIFESGSYTQYKNYQQFLDRFDFFEHANFSYLHHPHDTNKNIKDDRGLSKVKSDIYGIFYYFANYASREKLNNYTPDISLSVKLSYIYKSPNQKETKKWFDEACDMINQQIESIKSMLKSNDEIYSNKLDRYLGTYKTETLAPDGYNKKLEEGELVNAQIINDIILCCRDYSLRKLPEPAFYLYSYNERCEGYILMVDSNSLINHINECLDKISFNDDFIQREIYAPDVINVIKALEDAKTCMDEQRHIDD